MCNTINILSNYYRLEILICILRVCHKGYSLDIFSLFFPWIYHINRSPFLMSHNVSWKCEVVVYRSWICYVYSKFVDNYRIYSCSHFTKELELLIVLITVWCIWDIQGTKQPLLDRHSLNVFVGRDNLCTILVQSIKVLIIGDIYGWLWRMEHVSERLWWHSIVDLIIDGQKN